MTVGVAEVAIASLVWAGTMVTLTVLTLRDMIRRRRNRWRIHVEAFGGNIQRHRFE